MSELWVVSARLGIDPVDNCLLPVDCVAGMGQALGVVPGYLVLVQSSADVVEADTSPGIGETVGVRVNAGACCDDAASVIAGFLSSRDSPLVLMASSIWWDDVACRVASRLGANLSVGCVGWGVDVDGRPVFLRTAYDCRLFARERLRDESRVVTLRLESHSTSDVARPIPSSLAHLEEVELTHGRNVTLVDRYRIDSLLVDVEESDVIVAGGRGVGGGEGFDLLERLASALGGTVAGSRIAVDNGWVSRDRQVGQTGKTVSPRLYIACGISGSSHHLLGMKQSEQVVAVNTDADAPMLSVADATVVGSCSEYVSAMIDELEHRRQGVAE